MIDDVFCAFEALNHIQPQHREEEDVYVAGKVGFTRAEAKSASHFFKFLGKGKYFSSLSIKINLFGRQQESCKSPRNEAIDLVTAHARRDDKSKVGGFACR